MFDPTACHVERDGQGDYLLEWHGVTPIEGVSIYMTDDAEAFYRGAERGEPLLRTREHRVRIANPDKSVRHYFYLQSDCGERIILAERRLSLEGTSNFRDLGGYETTSGQRLKWGKLYRSSKLSGLTGEDADYVHRLGLTVICDFRQVLEQELEPTELGERAPQVMASLPITPGSRASFMESLHDGIIEVEDAAGFMQEINRDFVASQLPRYAEMFQLLLLGDQQVLIHCASGKDRTGFGAALILDVLGVDEDTIFDDYLLTNRYLPVDAEVDRLARELRTSTGEPVTESVLRPMLEVRPEYIEACFDEIRKRYDSREHFYATALNLDPEKVARLQSEYLHD